jgi:NAD(P)-dependent dehydrogenase (short-subunit alcohol dehydrogenase family)
MKSILIIGGSQGIGHAILEALKNDHYIHCISRNKVMDTASKNVLYYNLDITSEEVLPEIEALDTIIYCPGSINLKPFTSLPLEDFRRDIEINVIGAIKVIKHYLSALKKSDKNPSITLFSTVANVLGMPFHSSVSVSKGAVEGLVKSLAAELAPTIRVNAIAPTVTDTPLASKILRNDRLKEKIKERHPLNDYLEATEVAGLATFLLSNNAKSISGQIIPMDYGIGHLKL